MKKSLGIRDWESAQKIVRDWEARIEGGSQSVTEAFGHFLADCGARHLKPETIAKYRLLQRLMIALFPHRSVDSLGLEEISTYREMEESKRERGPYVPPEPGHLTDCHPDPNNPGKPICVHR
jgi:hypothetical protein